jgi:hypothetical protein
VTKPIGTGGLVSGVYTYEEVYQRLKEQDMGVSHGEASVRSRV